MDNGLLYEKSIFLLQIAKIYHIRQDIRLLGARTGIESAHVLRGWFSAGSSVIPNVKLHQSRSIFQAKKKNKQKCVSSFWPETPSELGEVSNGERW
jgi:hypothetical protein